MNKNQKGFAHLETLLILIVVLLIAFIDWFVWHTKQQADKSLDSASSANFGSVSKKAGSSAQASSGVKKTTTLKPSASNINYATTAGSDGVQISGDSDIDKLDGASDSFKTFVKGQFDKNSHNPSPCGNAYGLFVKQIYKDDFAVGAEKQCNNTQKLWAKISGSWTEIGASQDVFDCSTLEQYKVPSVIVSQCIKNGQIVDNNQE